MGIRRGLTQLERAQILHKSAFGHPEAPLSATGSRSALGETFAMKQQTIIPGTQEMLKIKILFVQSKLVYLKNTLG